MTVAKIVGVGVVGPGFHHEDPVAILGARGLRYRDEATRLGLAAAKLALEDTAGDYAGVTGVIASSNLGNLDTVCRVSSAMHSADQVFRSPLDLPNASSNVIASSIAIRFGLRGPNIMSCNGATSGLDALRWAEVILAAGRAERVVVVGVEVRNETTEHFARPRGSSGLFHGAACVILEGPSLESRGVRGLVDGHANGKCLRELADGLMVERWFVPDEGRPESPPPNLHDVPIVDLAFTFGAASGALGILQAATAVGQGGTSLLTAGGSDTPFARCLVTSDLSAKSGVHI